MADTPPPPKGQVPPPPPSRRGTEPGPPPAKRAEMRDAVQDVMRKVQADRDAQVKEALAQHAKDHRRRSRGIALVVLAALLLAAAAWWAVPRWKHPFAERQGPAAERDARSAIVFVAKLVDTFQAQHQRLPHTLHETGVVLPGIQYTEGVGRYTLSARAAGHTITFVSTEDRGAFLAGR